MWAEGLFRVELKDRRKVHRVGQGRAWFALNWEEKLKLRKKSKLLIEKKGRWENYNVDPDTGQKLFKKCNGCSPELYLKC